MSSPVALDHQTSPSSNRHTNHWKSCSSQQKRRDFATKEKSVLTVHKMCTTKCTKLYTNAQKVPKSFLKFQTHVTVCKSLNTLQIYAIEHYTQVWTSLLHTTQVSPWPLTDATPPTYKIHPFSKISIILSQWYNFDVLCSFKCLHLCKIVYFISRRAISNRLGLVAP